MGFLQNLMQAPAPGSRGEKFGMAMGNMAPLLFAMAKGLGEGKSASTYAPSGLAAMMLQQQTEADRKMRQEDRDYSRSQDSRMWDWRESGRAREDAAMAREDALRRQAGDDLESVLGGFNATGVTDPARQAFDSLQTAWGSPLTVNSAYRSPEHNARVGGAKNSQHTHGNAFDVDVSGLSREERLRLIQEARRNGFRGIGVYDNALHFDVGPARAWGADYSSKSLPEWAMAAATGPISGIPVEQPSQAAGQPRISPQRARDILMNPYATDAAKQMVLAQFMPQEEDKDQRARKIDAYMRLYGYDEATATALADDIIAVSRDPLTGEAALVDKRSILGAKDAYQADAPVNAGAGQPPPLSFNLPGVNDAFGLEGFGKGLANTGADIIGAPVPFADVQEAQSDFAVLKEDILSDLANGYRRQPPSWVLQALDDLTPKAGQPFSGAQGAQSKLRALDRKFEREIGLAQQQLRRRMKPGDRAEIEGQLTALEAARARVQGMLGAFGGGNTAGGIPQLFLDGVGDLPDGLTAADVWAEMSDDEKAAFMQ